MCLIDIVLPVDVHVSNFIGLWKRTPFTKVVLHRSHWLELTSIFLSFSSQLIDHCVVQGWFWAHWLTVTLCITLDLFEYQHSISSLSISSNLIPGYPSQKCQWARAAVSQLSLEHPVLLGLEICVPHTHRNTSFVATEKGKMLKTIKWDGLLWTVQWDRGNLFAPSIQSEIKVLDRICRIPVGA